MMPECGTRGMELIAEAGALPQSRLYGSISTRNTTNINTNNHDKEFRFCVMLSIVSLINAGDAVYLVFNWIQKYSEKNSSVRILLFRLFCITYKSYMRQRAKNTWDTKHD